VELSIGDVTQQEFLRGAVVGCDAVIHCAYGSAGSALERRQVDIDGTSNLLLHAAKAGVSRFVYVSTMMAYEPTDAVLTEASPRYRGRDPYASSKLAAETMLAVRGRELGIETVVVQPTVVYGPYGGFWTVRPLLQMKTGSVVLVDEGAGTCNAVYVDDVVESLLLAADHPAAAGEMFLVTGPRACTWAEFFGSYEHMTGRRALLVAGAEAARRAYAAGKRSLPFVTLGQLWRRDAEFRQKLYADPALRWLRASAHRLIPATLYGGLRRRLVVQERPGSKGPGAQGAVHWPSPQEIEFLVRRTAVDATKIARLIGFRPRFALARGMYDTEAWARWQGLL
jgi:nucleoside-diphosphate-sugar epimerase